MIRTSVIYKEMGYRVYVFCVDVNLVSYTGVKRKLERILSLPGKRTWPVIISARMQPADHKSTESGTDTHRINNT